MVRQSELMIIMAHLFPDFKSQKGAYDDFRVLQVEMWQWDIERNIGLDMVYD